jgi:hypothetical protein
MARRVTPDCAPPARIDRRDRVQDAKVSSYRLISAQCPAMVGLALEAGGRPDVENNADERTDGAEKRNEGSTSPTPIVRNRR